MPRRVQDIVPGDRRGIRDLPLERARKERASTDSGNEPETEIPIHKKRPEAATHVSAKRKPPLEALSVRRMPVTPPTTVRPRREKGRVKWFLVALGIVVVIGIIGFIASSHYSKASFTIAPKTLPITVNGTYVAQATTGSGVLSYEVVTVKGSASSTIPATDGPQTSSKAIGKITLYNAYSGQTVRLIAGTRFVSDAGLIYRLSSSVVIPGDSSASGVVLPGKISADVIADQAGQAYNLSKADASDLKIVAYQNSAKYDSIYAKLSSDLTGGLVGTKKITNPATVASTTARLKTELTSSLLTQVQGVIPDGYIMYPNNYSAAFSEPIVGGADHNIATVAVQGSVYGILFKKSDLLSKFSSNQTDTLFGSFGYTSPGLDSLQVVITNLKDFSPDKKSSLVIHAKGDLKIIGSVPVEDIKKKLEGMSLAGTQDVFKSYSAVIASGSGELVPPWAKIPTDPKRITITVQGQ